ncbi:MAG: ABC transporter substrate-binding protein [Anaerolineaceae bacterium]|nr:ABC transporter substrate-binding protein [Anaerolineaceae bacterium]
MTRKLPLILALIATLILTACQTAPAETPTADGAEWMEMTFMPGYKPQANLPFVGAYVAQEKGYFEEQHLKVTIQHSPGRGEHLQLLAAGKVHVTTQDAGVMLQRRADPGLPLVSIALIGQRGQQAFAALAESGIQTPADWAGHTVGYKGTPPPDLFALMKAAGLESDQVELINVGFDPRILSEGKIDIYPLYKSNEPYLLQSWGYELVVWDAADYGVPTLGLTYVTSDEILAEQPELLTRFLAATIKGIQYAAEHPEETAQIVLQYAGPEADADHQQYMLESELADAVCEQGYGWQTMDQWQAMADMLTEFDVMEDVDVSQAFTTEILEAAQERMEK